MTGAFVKLFRTEMGWFRPRTRTSKIARPRRSMWAWYSIAGSWQAGKLPLAGDKCPNTLHTVKP